MISWGFSRDHFRTLFRCGFRYKIESFSSIYDSLYKGSSSVRSHFQKCASFTSPLTALSTTFIPLPPLLILSLLLAFNTLIISFSFLTLPFIVLFISSHSTTHGFAIFFLSGTYNLLRRVNHNLCITFHFLLHLLSHSTHPIFL